MQFVVSQLHPRALARKVVEAQISRESYILHDKTSYTLQMIEDYFQSRNLALFTVVELGSMDAIKELVKLNLGISVLAP